MAAIRTITTSPLAGSRPNRWEPQIPQKDFASPPGGVQSRSSASPLVIVSDSAATLAEA